MNPSTPPEDAHAASLPLCSLPLPPAPNTLNPSGLMQLSFDTLTRHFHATQALDPALLLTCLGHLGHVSLSHERTLKDLSGKLDDLQRSTSAAFKSLQSEAQTSREGIMGAIEKLTDKLSSSAAEHPRATLGDARPPVDSRAPMSQADYWSLRSRALRYDPSCSVTLLGPWWGLALTLGAQLGIAQPDQPIEGSQGTFRAQAPHDRAAATALYLISPGARRRFRSPEGHSAAVTKILEETTIHRTRSGFATVVTFPSLEAKLLCFPYKGDYGEIHPVQGDRVRLADTKFPSAHPTHHTPTPLQQPREPQPLRPRQAPQGLDPNPATLAPPDKPPATSPQPPNPPGLGHIPPATDPAPVPSSTPPWAPTLSRPLPDISTLQARTAPSHTPPPSDGPPAAGDKRRERPSPAAGSPDVVDVSKHKNTAEDMDASPPRIAETSTTPRTPLPATLEIPVPLSPIARMGRGDCA